jgi:cysteine desulfurase
VLATCPEKRHLITSAVEHSAILMQCQELERSGYQVDYLPVDQEGRLDPHELEKRITPETALVSLMWANNETGVIFPIEQLGAICRYHRIPFHVDAVQAIGKIPINLRKSPVDLLSLSGHKFHASKGVGALYIRTGVRLKPLFWGGHQERGKRPGTEPVPLIVGLGKAAELCLDSQELLPTNLAGGTEGLRNRLQTGLKEALPPLILNGIHAPRLPNTLNVCFPEIEGEAMLLLMDQQGIAASSGSACLSHKLEPSHVLLAMGLSPAITRGAIRFSLSRYTTREEIEEVIAIVPRLYRQVINQFSLERMFPLSQPP